MDAHEYAALVAGEMGAPEEMGAFALAYQEAIHVREQAELEARDKEEAAALAAMADHEYDQWLDPPAAPHDLRMYEGTGVGALYGLPGTSRFLPELGDWRITTRRTR